MRVAPLDSSLIASLLLAAIACGNATATTWYVAPGGNDAYPGTQAQPWRSLAHAMSQLQTGDTLILRSGTWRLVEESEYATLIPGNIRIEAYPGEAPVILGSASTAGRTWQAMGNAIWRTPVDDLGKDPTGMFAGQQRIAHATDFSNGRNHADVSMLSGDEQWTKADDNGAGCAQANVGCYVYLLTHSGDPNARSFELAQRDLTRIVGDDVSVRGLRIFYTQPQPIFFEGAQRVLLENNVFGHVSNGDDNSYAVRIWDSQGSIVRGNEVFDSVYWGGTPNSKGVTFMVTRPGVPNVVENNHIHDIPGSAAVGTKGGTANLIVRNNRIENVFQAFDIGDARCVWSSTNTDGCQSTDVEYRLAGNWRIHGNIVRNSTIGLALRGQEVIGDDNWLYNNVFDQVETGIDIAWQASHGNRFANNLFVANRAAIYLSSGANTTTVSDYLDQFTSDHNLFFASTLADIHLRPNWGGSYESGTPYTLAQFQGQFGREIASIAADPQLVDPPADYHLLASSPARGNGDPDFWPGHTQVDRGAYPFADLLFADGFEAAD